MTFVWARRLDLEEAGHPSGPVSSFFFTLPAFWARLLISTSLMRREEKRKKKANFGLSIWLLVSNSAYVCNLMEPWSKVESDRAMVQGGIWTLSLSSPCQACELLLRLRVPAFPKAPRQSEVSHSLPGSWSPLQD